MSVTMQVEVWADIVCPWCGLGSHRLSEALRRFEHGETVEVRHRSYQLDPYAPVGETRPVIEMLRDDKGMSEQQVRLLVPRIEAMAEAEGLVPYRILDNRVGNTSLAHELLAYAAEQGRGEEAWTAMFRAYFGERAPIFDNRALARLGTDRLGLAAAGVEEVLASRRLRDAVLADQIEAERLGARGVPFFVIDRALALSGARRPDELLEALRQAWTSRTEPDRGGADEYAGRSENRPRRV